jgi:D-arabinose 1-dehydrogenase-like Zn-dependent alcohol dehydrogenase
MLWQALDTVQRGGQVVVTGLYGGTLPLPVATFPAKAISVHGVYVGTLVEFRSAPHRRMCMCVRVSLLTAAACGRGLMTLLDGAGGGAPIPLHERPLADVSAALQELRQGTVVGRLVIRTGAEASPSAL